MKTDIYKEIEKLENSSNIHNKKKGHFVRLVADDIKCFTCLDTQQYLRDRNNLPWSSFDGRGSYDLMGCIKCNNTGWKECSHSNICFVNNIRVYRKTNTNWRDRLEQLYILAKNKSSIVARVDTWIQNQNNIIEPTIQINEPLFEVCKRITKTHTETSLDVSVEIGKIVDIVKDIVSIYFGNTFSLIKLCSELKVSFSISDNRSISDDKLIKINGNNYLGIKTHIETSENKISSGIFRRSRNAKIYKADIFILKPLNEPAKIKAQHIMSKISNDMIDEIIQEF